MVESKPVKQKVSHTVILPLCLNLKVVDSEGEYERLNSLGGVAAILLFGFVFSAHPGAVR